MRYIKYVKFFPTNFPTIYSRPKSKLNCVESLKIIAMRSYISEINSFKRHICVLI